jgi:hypothetical protein
MDFPLKVSSRMPKMQKPILEYSKKMTNKICNNCNKIFKFIKKNGEGKYCSSECYKIFRKSHLKPLKKRYCQVCKVILILPWHRYCNKCQKRINSIHEEKEKITRNKYSLKRYYLIKDKLSFRNHRRKYLKQYQRDRVKIDSEYRLAFRIRNYFNFCLKNYSKLGKIKPMNKYGLDIKEIIEHLKPFPEDISKYHIDHIVPLSKFNLNDKRQIKIAFSPDNLQWLLAKENISKGNKNLPNLRGFAQIL